MSGGEIVPVAVSFKNRSGWNSSGSEYISGSLLDYRMQEDGNIDLADLLIAL
jgi:hypothetical protein